MRYEVVEFIDRGNLGRSAVAKLIAEMFLNSNGNDSIRIEASGTGVESSPTLESKIRFLTKYPLNDDHISLQDKISMEEAANFQSEKSVNSFHKHFINHYDSQEVKLTDYALENQGLNRTDYSRTQTSAKDDKRLIITMTQDNSVQVQQIYDENKSNVKIYTIGEFLDDAKINIPNAYGKDQLTHETMVDNLYNFIPKVIEKVIELNSKAS